MVKSPAMVKDLPPIKVKSGTEGDKHDPYGWTEIHVTVPQGNVVYRAGALGYERLYLNGEQLLETFGDSPEVAAQFKALTGMDPYEAESYYDLVWQEDAIGISLGRDIH